MLNAKRAELKEVEDRLASLKQQFEEKTAEKEKLEFQVGGLQLECRWAAIRISVGCN